MSAMNNPQTQKEIAKLLHYMTNLFSRLFKKNNGQNIIEMNEGQLKRLNDDLQHVINGQNELAKNLKKDGKHLEAAYMEARAGVLNDMKETLDPKNMENFSEAPVNVSPQEFAQRFQNKFEEALKDNDLKKNLQSVKAHRFNFDELNKLDKEIVESRFAYGSDRDKMVHAGLSVANSVMSFELQNELDKESKAGVKYGKDMRVTDPNTGEEFKKDQKTPNQNIKPGIANEQTHFTP